MNSMIQKITNIDLSTFESCKNDILLNKKLTNISPSNMYEILFDCENFDNIFNIFLNKLKKETNEDFNVYVKNMWGYIQTEEENNPINFNRNFKNQITIPSEYSFIYFIELINSKIYLKNDKDTTEIIDMNVGDIIIFNTEKFIKDESEDKKRIALVGSLSSNIQTTLQIKKVVI